MPDAIPPEPRAAPPRPRRRGSRPLVILIVILFPFAAFAVWSRVQTHRLDAALDVIEARGELLNPSSFDPHAETAEQQEAARLYGQAVQLTGSVVTARFLPVAKRIDELAVLPRAQAARDPQLALLHEAEAPLDEALKTMDRAATLDARGPRRGDRGFFPAVSLTAAGKVRVAWLALSGDGDAAARALVSVMRLRRMEPFWFRAFAGSTRNSLRLLLTFADPPEPRLRELQQEYATLDRDLDVAQYLMFSRAGLLRAGLPSEFGDPDSDSRQRTNPFQILLTGLTKPLRASAVMSDLRRFDAVIDAARQPWPAKLDAIASTLKTSAGPSPEPARRPSLFTMLVRPWGSNPLPDIRIVTNIADAVSYARVSVAALAIARYRAAHAGALPPALHALVPAYLPEAPLDPYTGGELIYRPAGAAYKIYSVGVNRQDDGGTWEMWSDLWSNRRDRAKDFGIAVGEWPAPR